MRDFFRWLAFAAVAILAFYLAVEPSIDSWLSIPASFVVGWYMGAGISEMENKGIL